MVELHAVQRVSLADQRIACCKDGDGEDEAYQAACALARVELGLEDE